MPQSVAVAYPATTQNQHLDVQQLAVVEPAPLPQNRLQKQNTAVLPHSGADALKNPDCLRIIIAVDDPLQHVGIIPSRDAREKIAAFDLTPLLHTGHFRSPQCTRNYLR